MVFQSIHPYDQQLVAEYPTMDDTSLQRRIEIASQGFTVWKRTSFQQRADLLKRLATLLQSHRDEYARLITMEMGKILREAQAEIDKCATACSFYAEYGESYVRKEVLEERHMLPDMHVGYVVFEPLGVILAIMPWNFPFWQVFRCAVPSVMAGNTVVLKHAPNVTGCALAIERLFNEAGAPEGVFQALVVDNDTVERIIAHDAIQGVALTGSECAGASVASLAGKYIKRSVLELGGSDPLIVLDDADLEQAATVAVQSRMQNAGQSCIASKRFIVHAAVYDDFVYRIQQKISALKQGNPFDNTVTTGPMARIDLAEKLAMQVRITKQQGGELLIGSIDTLHTGANFAPSLIVNAPQESPAFREELFGPVAVVVKAASEQEAVYLANASRYGLGASIWTQDRERGQHIARQIEAGSVFINGLVKSTPQLPFGGIKKSGYGRELSYFGMKEFMNAKTVYVCR
ncbi:MAG: NAD-dependent succinate-semialdehyde dehydrogenase [Candidatus Kapabacteria bacterium]|nr:NAD-dependent succinate-semialdehyde dehydrogenase [Candidatus Kapabacteria bacterium]